MTFFEIDPVVIQVASDPRYFTYLSDAPTRPTVIEGDARLSFENEPTGRYDMLIMDAFSSDSVPVHLLTAEAIADELRITKPDGTIVFHVSNRYYNLAPPIAAAVTAQGLTILEKWHTPGAIKEPGETPSHWLAASRDAGTLERYAPRAGPPSPRATALSPTTTRTYCATYISACSGTNPTSEANGSRGISSRLMAEIQLVFTTSWR